MTRLLNSLVPALVVAMTVAACGGNKPPVAVAPPPSGPPPFPGAAASGTTPARPPDPPPIPGDASVGSTPLDPFAGRSIDEINGPNSPLKPVHFLYDSDTLDDEAKKVLAANAEVLKTNRTWVITVEGHCDERGTAEYNLSLGDRRAEAARSYLVSLGIAAERLRKVSFGKEFPFDTGRTEDAFAKNRRAHFMLTSK
jgi:peptidoglycan-associated lipoprotein